MRHSRMFWACVFLIMLGFVMYLFGLILSLGITVANPSWVLYLAILGLNVTFYSGATFVFSSVIERKPKKIFKEAAVLLTLAVLSYLMAGWLISGYPFADGHLLNAWAIFSLNRGLWTYGFNFLLIGIAVSCLEGFEMIIVSAVRAFKGWIGKPHNGDTVIPFQTALT